MTTITGYTSYTVPLSYTSATTTTSGQTATAGSTSSASTLVSISANAVALYNATLPTASALIADYDFTNKTLKSGSKLTLPIDLGDTAANIVSGTNLPKLATILADSPDNIKSITFSDTTKPTVKFSAASTNTITSTPPGLEASKTVLAKIQSIYNLSISDIAYSDFKALNASDYGAASTPVLTGLKDSLANITSATNLVEIAALVSAKTLTSIKLSDTTAPTDATELTIADYNSVQPAIKLIPSTASFSLKVKGAAVADLTALAADKRVTSIALSDTAANIASGIANIKNLFAKSPTLISKLEITPADDVVTLTAAQAIANKDVLSASVFKDLHIRIADTAANIASNISGLDALANSVSTNGAILDSVTASDGNAVTVSAADLIADYARDPVLFQGNSIKITNASLAQLANIKTITDPLVTITGVDVSDTAAGLSSDLASDTSVIAAAMAANVTINSIAISDSKPLRLSADTATNQSDVLKLIPANYTIQVTGNLTASDALALQSPAPNAKLTFAIVDTGSNIGSNLDDLQALVKSGNLTGLSLTDQTSPITLTPAQYKSDSDALKLIKGRYALVFTDATIADLAGLATAPNISKIGITDNGNALGKNLSSLINMAKLGKLGPVTVSDDAPIAVTPKQYAALSAYTATDLPFASANFKLINATASEIDALATPGPMPANIASVDLQDTSLNIGGKLEMLKGINDLIGKITFTNKKPEMTMTAAQMDTYSDVLGLVQTGYKLTLSDDLKVDDALGLASPSTNATLSLHIVDTQANIQDNLDALQPMVKSKQLTSVAMSDADPATPFTLSAASLKNDVDVIKLLKPAALKITDATVADALNLPAVIKSFKLTAVPPFTFALNDTASNLSAGWANLDALAKKNLISDISVSDGNPIALTYATAKKSAILAATQSTPVVFHDGVSLVLTNLKASDVPAANTLASTLAGMNDFAKVIGAEISDTASNIAKNLNDLSTNKLADGSLLASKITVSDKMPMTLTYDQLTATDLTNVLSLIGNAYSIKMDSKTVVSVTQALSLAAPNKNATILPFAVTDTPDNITANLADLIKLVSSKSVSQINLASSGGAPAVIKLTKDQLTKAAPVLALLRGSYGIGLLNLSAADATALAKTAKLQSMTLKDSLANLSASVASLTSVLSKVSTVTLTDANVDKAKLDILKAALAKANPAIVVQDAKGATV